MVRLTQSEVKKLWLKVFTLFYLIVATLLSQLDETGMESESGRGKQGVILVSLFFPSTTSWNWSTNYCWVIEGNEAETETSWPGSSASLGGNCEVRSCADFVEHSLLSQIGFFMSTDHDLLVYRHQELSVIHSFISIWTQRTFRYTFTNLDSSECAVMTSNLGFNGNDTRDSAVYCSPRDVCF